MVKRGAERMDAPVAAWWALVAAFVAIIVLNGALLVKHVSGPHARKHAKQEEEELEP